MKQNMDYERWQSERGFWYDLAGAVIAFVSLMCLFLLAGVFR